MTTDMNKGMAFGLLIAYFLISPIINAIKIGGATIYVIIGLAAYLFFIKK